MALAIIAILPIQLRLRLKKIHKYMKSLSIYVENCLNDRKTVVQGEAEAKDAKEKEDAKHNADNVTDKSKLNK